MKDRQYMYLHSLTVPNKISYHKSDFALKELFFCLMVI